MKKYILLIMTILTVLGVLPVSAGAPTEYEIPETGTEINGFKVTDVSYWDSFATDVVKLEHEKSGAVLYWLANDNIDRSFQAIFRTPINDDTGIPHVFEHATLAGSKKYPGANTFTELTNKTSSTYLNAQTKPYLTLYPMGSTSEEQLLKYMDFYMSGLTEPLAVEDPYALMSEAYRYELKDPDGEITLQGVVYSEMLGLLNQNVWAGINFKRMIWPGSYVTIVNGGDPDHIPELTQEAVKEFHEKYYHPANATMYLVGDVDLPRFLELLDHDFLSKYERAEIPIEDTNYVPLEPGYYEQTFDFPVEKGTPTEKAARIYYGMPFRISDFNETVTLVYAASYMNDESSPLQRLKNERLPEAEIAMTVSLEPEGKTALVFSGSGIDGSEKDIFRQLCDDALSRLLEEGVNEEVLHGMLVRERFTDLMELDSSSVYFDCAQYMADLWGLFDDRDAWKMDNEFEKNLTEFVTAENLNAAVRKYWTDPDTAVMAVTVPAPGLREEKDAALRAKLDEMKASMTPEEVDALVEQTKDYQAFVEESNAILMPEELNALTAETLPEEISYKPASETTVGGIRLVTSEVDSPLIRVSVRTDTSAIPFEDLFDYAEYTWLLENLGTEKYTREELPAKIAAVSAGMTMFNNYLGKEGTRDIDSYFLASWYALPETLEDSFALVEEILYHTDFSDYDYIRAEAASNYAQNQMYMNYNSSAFGAMAVSSNFEPVEKLNYYLNTEAQMEYWDKLSKYTDEEMDALVQKFEGFRDIMLNKKNTVLTVMGNSENILRSTALGYDLVSGFDDTVRESVDYAARIEDLPLHTAVITGGNVAFNFAAADLEAAGYEKYDGGLRVIMKILDDKLLYPELRVKNSAYGGYSDLFGDYTFGCYSYRDPKVAETFAVYETVGDFLRELEISETELEGYITSVYGDLTRPVGPLSAALKGISDLVTGVNSYDRTLKMIRDIKAFRQEDIAKYAPLGDAIVSDSASRVTTGMRSMIEANAELYDYINYNLMDEEEEEEAGETGTDEDLIAAIAALSPEEIEEMAASMDEEDLRSVVSYVMDQFTDEDGKIDEAKVFELVGGFMNGKWSGDEIEEAVEELEPDEDESVTDQETVDGWMGIFDAFMKELNAENMTGWLQEVFSAPADSAPAEGEAADAVSEGVPADSDAADAEPADTVPADSTEEGGAESAVDGLISLIQGLFSAYVTETNE